VNNSTASSACGFSSFRSTTLFCWAIMSAGVSGYLGALMLSNHRYSKTFQSDPLQLVSINDSADSLPPGSHLVSPRNFYMHHGIYLGGKHVAHYSGYSRSYKPGPIEVTDLESFANGKPVWMYQRQCEYSNDEIVNRARSRVGENQYKILSNNCEHFCSWCIKGKSHSAQINACFHCPGYLFSFIAALTPHFFA
jgi:hypothetical protein